MDSDDEHGTVDRAFRLLSDGTRLDILRAVWAADGPVSFSTLRERVGNPNSGRFNYHVGELRGRFLRGETDGYVLTQAGREVVRAVVAGTLTDDRPRVERTAIDGHCVDCGGALAFEYDDHGRVACVDCDVTVMWNEFPPAGTDGRTPAAVARAFDRWTHHRFRLATEGVCPSCAGEMATTLPDPSGDGTDTGVETLATVHRCRTCKYEARIPLFGHVVSHPAVVATCYEAGVDVTDLPYWELRDLAREFSQAVVSTDPWTARVTLRVDDRELELTLDETLDVVVVESP